MVHFVRAVYSISQGRLQSPIGGNKSEG